MSDLPNTGGVEGSAQYSPMTLLMRFFNDKGISKPNAQMIRDALAQNAREPGYIPGLVNMEAVDSAPAQSSTRVGGTGSAGSGGRTLPLPPDYVPPPDAGGGGTTPATGGPATGGGSPTTSAAPPGAGGPGWSPNAGQIATAIGLTGLLPAAVFAARAARGGGAVPGASVPPPVDPGAGVAPVAPDAGVRVPGVDAPPLVAPEAQTTPLDTALNRATDVPTVPFDRSGRTQLTAPTPEDLAQIEALRNRPGGAEFGPDAPAAAPAPAPAAQAPPAAAAQPPPAPETVKEKLKGAQRWFKGRPRIPGRG